MFWTPSLPRKKVLDIDFPLNTFSDAYDIHCNNKLKLHYVLS